ncbi:MAG: 2-polyprenyl-3-methyl-6-methoxy-1,4-benzoquinone monooxygenase [Pseudomonadota bacterium]
MANSNQSPVDRMISVVDNGLRVVFAKPNAKRASPASESVNGAEAIVSDPIKQNSLLSNESAALMRVNHVGEVCAQALYQGQALTSRSAEVREKMRHAAEEEIDHLNWCAERIEELGGKQSIFNPLWYAGSFALGVGAGIAGDKWSLGFLAETEKQVVDHLKSHLERLPDQDIKSRQIVSQMVIDEQEHAEMAEDNGAAMLPQWVKNSMRLTAKVMTSISERI